MQRLGTRLPERVPYQIPDSSAIMPSSYSPILWVLATRCACCVSAQTDRTALQSLLLPNNLN